MRNLTVKVKKEFLDKYTGLTNKVGTELTITEARYREIKRSGDYVEVVKTEAKEKK